jgi:FkbM family methyltransferase
VVKLKTIAGHTVDLDLLPAKPRVLDVGCRGFDFCQGILEERPQAKIIALDPDPKIKEFLTLEGRVGYKCVALVAGNKKVSGYASYSTGEGNMLTDLESYYDAKMLEVPCINIVDLMRDCGVKHWDLVKLDCEGSEFDILANWPGPIATQISVEFHDGHPEEIGTHRNGREIYFADVFRKLRPPYKIVQHELFKQGAWFGHWDTLLTL